MPKPREIPQNLPDNNRRLIALMQATFGANWQNATARALGVGVMQVNRWVWGGYEVPDEKLAQAYDVAKERVQDISRAMGGKAVK